MCKNCLGWSDFRKKLGFFVLYEHNKFLVTDIWQMEELFSLFFPDLSALDCYFVIMKGRHGLS